MFFLHFSCHLTICPTKPSTEKAMENVVVVLGSAGTGRAAVNMVDCYWIKIIMIDFDWIKTVVIDFYWIKIIMIDFAWIKLTLPKFVFLPAVEILGGLGGGSQPLAGMAPGLKKKESEPSELF